MRIFVCTLAVLGVALVSHLIWWRIRVPRRQLPALVKCFALAFVIGGVAAVVTGIGGEEVSAPQCLRAALYYWALACTYVITYASYVEVDSPTLTLMRELGLHHGGLAVEQAEKLIASRPFLTARLEALKRDGLVIEREGRILASGKPAWLLRGFQIWGRLLNVSEPNG